MDKNNIPSPEELQDEQDNLAEVKDNDIRSSLVDSLGLEDNEDNSEFIDKLVEREKENKQKLSSAIGAKIKWRETAQSKLNPEADEQKTEQKPEQFDAEAIRKQAEEAVTAKFDEQYLDNSGHPDELKEEIRRIAKMNGTSAQSAANDPYIQFKMSELQSEEQAGEAATNGKGERRTGTDTSQGMPEKFNDPTYMVTAEGQKAFEEWQESTRS